MAIIIPQELEGMAETNPQLYTAMLSIINQLNQTQPNILSGNSDPEGLIPAAPGTLYLQRDSLTGALVIHAKDIGTDNSGWAELGAFGSIPPASAAGFQYTSTTNSITWWYDGTHGSQVLVIYRANGDKVTIPAGNITITGLQPNTTYYFYPYYDERTGSLQWLAGNIGIAAIAFTSPTSKASQDQRLTNRIPMGPSNGMVGATTAAGTGGGTGGGGVGGFGRLD